MRITPTPDPLNRFWSLFSRGLKPKITRVGDLDTRIHASGTPKHSASCWPWPCNYNKQICLRIHLLCVKTGVGVKIPQK